MLSGQDSSFKEPERRTVKHKHFPFQRMCTQGAQIITHRWTWLELSYMPLPSCKGGGRTYFLAGSHETTPTSKDRGEWILETIDLVTGNIHRESFQTWVLKVHQKHGQTSVTSYFDPEVTVGCYLFNTHCCVGGNLLQHAVLGEVKCFFHVRHGNCSWVLSAGDIR